MPSPIPPILHTTLEAALTLAADRPWKEIKLLEIAEAAKVDIADLYGVADKDTLMDALESWADKAMSAEASEPDETPRERLFDTLMRRFERFEEHRAGVLSLMKARDKSAQRMAALLGARSTAAQWALACAGLDQGTPTERAARKLGVAWIIAKTERAWRSDESGDFARTMATLDAELVNAEDRLKRFSRFTRRRNTSGSSPSSAETSPPEAPQAETSEG